MMYVRLPLCLRNDEDLLFERGDRHLAQNFGFLVESFRAAICCRQRVSRIRDFKRW
jgi:hypothetical protein